MGGYQQAAIGAVCCIVIIGGIMIGLLIWNEKFRYDDDNSPSEIVPADCELRGGFAFQSNCYSVGNLLNWYDAEVECNKLAGHLASVPSANANEFITTLLFAAFPNATSAWIGLNNLETLHTYVYSDGSNVSYTNFASETLSLAPAVAQERRCVGILSNSSQYTNATAGEWGPDVCATPRHYICSFAAVTRPSPPLSPHATATSGGASVSFTKPTIGGGSTIRNYTVISSNDGGNVTSKGTSSNGKIVINVNGLDPYSTYSFQVLATNDVGASILSTPSNSITPLPTPPRAPTDVVAIIGNAAATLTFVPPTSDGGSPILTYRVRANQTSGQSLSQNYTYTASLNSVSFSGLTNGQQYCFDIAAINNVGVSAATAAASCITPNNNVAPPPTNVVATAGAKSATVSWNAPAAGSYSAITSYQIISLTGEGNETAVNTTQTCPCSHPVSGLIVGTSYTFTIVAFNSAGRSIPSLPSNAVIPYATEPSAPSALVATAGGRSATIAFTIADDGGSEIANYTVEIADATNTLIDTLTISASLAVNNTLTVYNLTAGSTYTFRLFATNAIGDSAYSLYSSSVLILADRPSPPLSVSAVAIAQGAAVSFTASADSGGSTIHNYTVVSIPDGVESSVAAGSGTDFTVNIGLLRVNVSYTFQVYAANDVGRSAPSDMTNAVVPFAQTPSAPTNVVATPGNQSATVTWQAPSNDGGAPIINYLVVSIPPTFNLTTSSSVTQLFFTGLNNVSITWSFKVYAINELGQGLESIPSDGILVHATRPDPPVNVQVEPSLDGVVVSFLPPSNDGGSAITRYIVIPHPSGPNTTNTKSPIVVNDIDYNKPYSFTVVAVNALGESDPSAPSETITLSKALAKDLAIPIAGGIILALLGIVSIILCILYCRNNEKLCWALSPDDPTKGTDIRKEEQHVEVQLEPTSSGQVATEEPTSSGQVTTEEPASADQTTEEPAGQTTE